MHTPMHTQAADRISAYRLYVRLTRRPHRSLHGQTRPGGVYQPESPMGEVVSHHLALRISLNVNSGIESFCGLYFLADMSGQETMIG